MLLPFYKEGLLEAGCDEAGRGCLAGPVYAAAVVLPADVETRCPELAAGLNDSKQLTEKKRYALRELIQRDALAWAVGVCDNHEIDEKNILRCSILAMQRALDKLSVRPQFIIVDGNRWSPYTDPEGNEFRCVQPSAAATAERGYTTIVKGDGKYMAIAAASILAKTYRDDYMLQLHPQYPQYRWDSNKGYPAKAHREAIRLYGTTPYHRMSFNLLGTGQLEFDFGE